MTVIGALEDILSTESRRELKTVIKEERIVFLSREKDVLKFIKKNGLDNPTELDSHINIYLNGYRIRITNYSRDKYITKAYRMELSDRTGGDIVKKNKEEIPVDEAIVKMMDKNVRFIAESKFIHGLEFGNYLEVCTLKRSILDEKPLTFYTQEIEDPSIREDQLELLNKSGIKYRTTWSSMEVISEEFVKIME